MYIEENGFHFLIFSLWPIPHIYKKTQNQQLCAALYYTTFYAQKYLFVSVKNEAICEELPNIDHERGNFSSYLTRQNREEFADYFVNEGHGRIWTLIKLLGPPVYSKFLIHDFFCPQLHECICTAQPQRKKMSWPGDHV